MLCLLSSQRASLYGGTGRVGMSFFEKYIQTKYWRQLVDTVTRAQGAKCCKCGHNDYLTARHRTYERIGAEKSKDLEVICELCNSNFPQDQPSDETMCIADKHGWAALAVITEIDWGPYESEAFAAWERYRTLNAAQRAKKMKYKRDHKRRWVSPEYATPIDFSEDEPTGFLHFF